MTIGEVTRKVRELLELHERLSKEEEKIPDGGTMTITKDDLLDCIQCINDCIRFINKTKVDL